MESERRTPDNTDEGRFQNRPISGFLKFSRFRLEVNWPGGPVGGSRKRMLRICLKRPPEASILHGIAPNSIRMRNTQLLILKKKGWKTANQGWEFIPVALVPRYGIEKSCKTLFQCEIERIRVNWSNSRVRNVTNEVGNNLKNSLPFSLIEIPDYWLSELQIKLRRIKFYLSRCDLDMSPNTIMLTHWAMHTTSGNLQRP